MRQTVLLSKTEILKGNVIKEKPGNGQDGSKVRWKHYADSQKENNSLPYTWILATHLFYKGDLLDHDSQCELFYADKLKKELLLYLSIDDFVNPSAFRETKAPEIKTRKNPCLF